MTRRPAVTLIEVLVSMFIMAIGMLALLVLFPLGAVNMGQALKDDRCASTAAMGESVAIAMNVRHDGTVETGFASSLLVYVDPNGAIQGLPAVGGVIPRVTTSFAGSQPLADRWFSLPDDIAFLDNGTPNMTSTFVDRGRRYSYAYLLRRLQPADKLVQLFVVVYNNRPVGVLTPEPTVNATIIAANGLAINGTGLTIKRGSWILDTSGNFYRVTNIDETGGNTVLETQRNIQPPASSPTITIMLMENVAEVFDKGTSWQP